MDITTMIQWGLSVIGGATILFRALVPIVKETSVKWDEKIVMKVLKILTTISGAVALNKVDSKIEIKLKR